MKGKNTISEKPFRYGGIMKEYDKELHQITGTNGKCWCCGGDMKSHVIGHKSLPYMASFKITKGIFKGKFKFHPLCRSCAYNYEKGVIEVDGSTYFNKNDFNEKEYLKTLN